MRASFWLVIFAVFLSILPAFNIVKPTGVFAQDSPVLEQDFKAERVGLKTDDYVVQREEQAISSEGFSVAEKRLIEEGAEKFQFQAEVNKLMGIIINSLYSNKDIFLRELISNASDALDKIRFLTLTDQSLLGEHRTFDIRIRADPEGGVLHITDTGVGMTKQELTNNLGTIAKSGTKEFIDNIAKTGDSNLIGQFGVGFYSAFLVADQVTVTSKHNDDPKQWVWVSEKADSFSISEDPRGNTLGRGTRISLVLKEDAKDYLKPEVLKGLILKYSEFIDFPIYVWSSHEEEEEVPVEDDEVEEEETVNLDKDSEETSETEEEKKPKTKTVKKEVWGWEQVNKNKPIWTRSPSEVTEEEYINFYKSFSKESADPLDYIHFSAEGEVEFKAILYTPAKAPQGLLNERTTMNGIKLYVRRVFITDDFGEIFPRYLQFIRGVVDSDDLPLNVSREILQQDRNLNLIKKKLVRKAIAMFQELAENEEEYNKFWEEFGVFLKLGVIEDDSNRERLTKLLRFVSSKTGKLSSIEDYISRKKESQTQIYFIAGENQESLERSPFVEQALKRGYEVLFFVDAIDEWLSQQLKKYDNQYTFVNLAKEGVKFEDDDIDEDKKKEIDEDFKPLTDFLKDALKGRISKAVVSTTLVHPPAALSSGSFGFTANMERLMKAQAFADQKQWTYLKSQRILDINPNHPLIIKMNEQIKAGDFDSESLQTASEILFNTAALHSGFALDDPSDFATQVHRLLKASLGVDPNAEAPEIEYNTSSNNKEEEEEEEVKEKEDEVKEEGEEKVKDEL